MAAPLVLALGELLEPRLALRRVGRRDARQHDRRRRDAGGRDALKHGRELVLRGVEVERARGRDGRPGRGQERGERVGDGGVGRLLAGQLEINGGGRGELGGVAAGRAEQRLLRARVDARERRRGVRAKVGERRDGEVLRDAGLAFEESVECCGCVRML